MMVWNADALCLHPRSAVQVLGSEHFNQSKTDLFHTLVDVGLRASQLSGGGYNLAVFSDSAKNAIEWNSESRPAFSCLFYNSRASHKIS